MRLKPPDHATEQQIAEAKEKAAKAIARVRGGEEFAKVAAAESEDETHKDTGGERCDGGGPVTGPRGFHVFQVTEIKRSDLKPFAEMKEQLSRELRRREQEKLTQNWLEDLRKKAYIDIKLQ